MRYVALFLLLTGIFVGTRKVNTGHVGTGTVHTMDSAPIPPGH